MTRKIIWPDGKRFAFSVFDDTDLATVDNVGQVYALLKDLGFRTTKSCWPLRNNDGQGKHPGQTLDDADYCQWLLELQRQGFEIGWHGSACDSSTRDRTAAALERFREVFQSDPAVAANHTGVAEAMYWGSQRLTGWRRLAYNLLTRYRNAHISDGHIEGSEHFWGDLCKRRIKYYRNFAFQDINTLKACSFMPYHDAKKPYVNYWFASSDGHDVASFNRCLSEGSQDRLEAEGGACIMYTHFALGFQEDRGLNSRFRQLMERLATKNGWFVPVGPLLDHLRQAIGWHEITNAERRRLERKWLWEKIFVGPN